jgi:hypothetical protein
VRSIQVLIFICFAAQAKAQDVLTLNPEELSPKAELNQLKWLSAYWVGAGLGGDCEELWMPALDNAMHGVFRLSIEGKIRFTEYMSIIEENGSLVLKVKHFSRDLTAWEEKENWVKFPLVKLSENQAYFSGISFFRDGESLIIKLAMRSGNESRIEELVLRRKELGN